LSSLSGLAGSDLWIRGEPVVVIFAEYGDLLNNCSVQFAAPELPVTISHSNFGSIISRQQFAGGPASALYLWQRLRDFFANAFIGWFL
jgi:hypothetical protein